MDLHDVMGVYLGNSISKHITFKHKVIEYDWRAKRKQTAQHIREKLLGASTVNKNKKTNKGVTSKKKKRRKR